MKCVRLPLLSRDFLLGHVDAESLVRHHPDCKDLLIEALKFHLLPEQRGVLGTSRTRPRRCEGAGPVLFAVGTPTCPASHAPALCLLSMSPAQAHPTLPGHIQSHPAPTPQLLLCTLLTPYSMTHSPTSIPNHSGTPMSLTLSCAKVP